MAKKCPRCGETINTFLGVGVHNCKVPPRHK